MTMSMFRTTRLPALGCYYILQIHGCGISRRFDSKNFIMHLHAPLRITALFMPKPFSKPLRRGPGKRGANPAKMLMI